MKLYPSLSPELAAWAARQPVFFTGSAGTHTPRINVSPKGYTSSHFAIFDSNTIAYVDRSGSGCETIANGYDNGRLTLLFISFGRSPRILRLFCRMKIIERGDREFDSWFNRVVADRRARDTLEDVRAVIVGHVWQVQTSCGYTVPRVKRQLLSSGGAAAGEEEEGQKKEDDDPEGLSVFEERPTLDDYWKKRPGERAITEYQILKNLASLDGLPGLRKARRAAGQSIWLTDLKARVRRALAEKDGMILGALLVVFFYASVVFGPAYLGLLSAARD
ncbi:pyridoxamine phosphate oxidase [Sodiomyces alkalinus F11]|uniref:Pyridoxamine phosphate oxidase n=1 Tax=Sodiomyces alkalinus (strain CBS 110278 / VKM F-3762 / F11) TaxID=1314773 RepID=A0A3N2Q9S9_SODAK|nr:pyridoxamine phosphate oxidase [Sodiomyces alkalinus F11]ROT43467.1 pyridoxamine phosphate oxidase [Sodiomyces alkalinus F11]